MRCFTREEMRSLDRKAIEVVGIPAAALMENAGRAVAEHAAEMARGGLVTIVCGHGSNGGDGFVAARHLFNRDVPVRVVALDAEKLVGAALANFRALRHCDVPVREMEPGSLGNIRQALAGAAVVVDAIFGTGLAGPVREPYPALFEALHGTVLSVDIPSGLDCDTGLPLGAAVRATRTVTLHAAKAGFEHGKEYTGEVVVADIGIPRDLEP